MESVISATELARTLGDVLARIRYRRESFVIERNGTPVARLVPVGTEASATLRDLVASWGGADSVDAAFADDLERVNAADQPPANPWASS